jgi:hypothetical protein
MPETPDGPRHYRATRDQVPASLIAHATDFVMSCRTCASSRDNAPNLDRLTFRGFPLSVFRLRLAALHFPLPSMALLSCLQRHSCPRAHRLPSCYPLNPFRRVWIQQFQLAYLLILLSQLSYKWAARCLVRQAYLEGNRAVFPPFPVHACSSSVSTPTRSPTLRDREPILRIYVLPSNSSSSGSRKFPHSPWGRCGPRVPFMVLLGVARGSSTLRFMWFLSNRMTANRPQSFSASAAQPSNAWDISMCP